MSVSLKPATHHHWAIGAVDAPPVGLGLGVGFALPEIGGAGLAAFGWAGAGPGAAPITRTGAVQAASDPATGALTPNVAQFAAPVPLTGTSPGNLTITVSFDSSVTTNSAPAGFQASVNAAVSFFETHLTAATPINITLHVGYGEIGGWGNNTAQALGAGALGQSSFTGTSYTYNQVKTALVAQTGSADQIAAAASLPTNNPTNLNNFFVADAQAQALGLDNSRSVVVGSIGFDNVDPVTWGTSDQVVTSGTQTYDGFATIEHEISEVLGRGSDVQPAGTAQTDYTTLDLLRYSAPNTPDLTANANGYFSLDNGNTNLGAFNDPTNGGDAGDWASSVTNDSFDAAGDPGVVTPVSTLDMRLMNVLGYTLTAPCYAAGTRILTARGEIAVEALVVGDLAVTSLAGLAPITWIGQRRLDCARHPDPSVVRPIRIVAGAFGPGLPHRDLVLSPEHAVAVEDAGGGALIPIRLLVNGGSIAQLTDRDRIVYYHIELDRHDILCAEGLPAESFLDAGNRGMFENGGMPAQLHPPAEDAESHRQRLAGSCLRLLDAPAEVEPHWRALAARSVALGFAALDIPTTDAPDLHLAVGAARIAPVWANPDRAVFVIPPGAAPARLVSRSMVPAALRPWVEDRRRLGVMVKGLTLRQGAEQTDIALDDPGIAGGWWAVERDAASIWRWTDGAALLPLTLALAADGAVLEVRLGERLAYPLAALNTPLNTPLAPAHSAARRAA